MTVLVSDFLSSLQTELNKGASFSSLIAGHARRAHRWMERNYSYKYMERFVTFDFDPDSDYPRVINLPGSGNVITSVMGFKSFNFIRIVNDDGSFSYLEYVEPTDIQSVGTGKPDAFWLDGVEYIYFNQTPDEAYSAEMSYHQYTDFPTDVDSTTWLLNNAEWAMICQAMVTLAGTFREPDVMASYKAMRDEELRTLTIADDELRDGTKDFTQVYPT